MLPYLAAYILIGTLVLLAERWLGKRARVKRAEAEREWGESA